MKFAARVGRCFALSFAALLLVGSAWAENWPQWRGPNNDGISKETNLPAQWSEAKNILWKLPMPGMGSSTPAVWGKRIFFTSENDTDLELLCISTEGKELWNRKLGSGKQRFMRGEGNNASASPSTDGTHVYAYTGKGDLACFDFEGNEVWKFNVQDRYGKFQIQHGMHVTPLLHGDRLYLSLIHSGAASIVALDKMTGKEVWKVDRQSDGTDENEHSYASPCIWGKGKEAYLVVHGNDYATAHRLTDGSEIWRVGDLNPKEHYNRFLRFVASPVATPDIIVVPSAKNGPVVGVKPDSTGLLMADNSQLLWRRPKGTPDVPSPLVYDGLVYLCRENGNLTCMDSKTGKAYYEEQRTHNAKHRASPVYADGKIYLTARDGVVTVVQTGPKFEVLSTNRLPDDLTASPAISNGRIYLRGWKVFYAIGLAGK